MIDHQNRLVAKAKSANFNNKLLGISKPILGLFLVIILTSSLVLSGCSSKKKSPPVSNNLAPSPTQIPVKTPEEAAKDGPFFSLIPSTDGHWLTIEIKNIPSETKSLEYELIYQAEFEGNLVERGVSTLGSPVELDDSATNGSNKKEFSKKILLGTASCTTVCKYKYDEGVKEGTFTLILNKTSSKEKYESPFTLLKGSGGKSGLFSKDEIFNFNSTNLSPNAVFIVVSTIGIPIPLTGNLSPQSAPYGIFSSASLKSGEVSFQTSLPDTSIYGYDGKSWVKLNSTYSNGYLKAFTTNQFVFILAK